MSEEFKDGAVVEGRYRILSRIGEGGMGVVYEAEHMHLMRKCAIKVLHPTEAGDQHMIDRFKIEAQSAANIRHANIVGVMDFGLIDGSLPFIVMELLQGESLADKLDREVRLTEREAVEITDQILSGLSAAHKYGVIHRDLKPENIFLAIDDQHREIVKILDFGISKIVRSTSGRAPLKVASEYKRLTQVGTILGTPGYMAPETLFGTQEVDARADLFSVGVILFEMLTGRQPFRGSDAHKIMLATASKPVPRPSHIRPGLSLAMEKLVLICLAKEPDDRFQTASEFLMHLTAAAVGRLPENARECRTKVGVPSIIPSVVPAPSSTSQAADINLEEQDPSSRYISAYPPPEPRTPARRDSYNAPRMRSYSPTARSRAPKPRRRARFSFPLTFFQTVFLLVLAGAVYYFFFYKEAMIADSHVDPVDEKIIQASKGLRSFIDKGNKTGVDEALTGADGLPAKPKTAIWIDANPFDVKVKWDGRTIEDRPLIVESGDEPVQVIFSAKGYEEERLVVVPNKEQVLKVRLKKIRK